jgi:hypothetical protein
MGWREILGVPSPGPAGRAPQNPAHAQGLSPAPEGFEGFEGFEHGLGDWSHAQAGPAEAGPRRGLAEEQASTNGPRPAAPMAEPDHGPAGPLDGLPLLAGDWRFIQRMARGRRRHALLMEYARRWRQAADAEPAPHRKAGAGRVAANTWLLDASQ